MISESEEDNEFVSGGPDWHMIIGGKNSSSVLKSVELFNWRTKEQESQTIFYRILFCWDTKYREGRKYRLFLYGKKYFSLLMNKLGYYGTNGTPSLVCGI